MQDTTIKTTTILSVVPGTRSSGVAVFEGLDLIYYGIKEASKHRSKHTSHSRGREAAWAVQQLIYKYQPNHFVTLAPSTLQFLSPKLPVITEQIASIARGFRLMLYEYQRDELREQLCPGGKATRQAVATHLSALYPELLRYAVNVSCWQRLYYARMFDAITAGYVHASRLQREHERLHLAQLDKRAPNINTIDP